MIKKQKSKLKSKSLHSITIEGCLFTTQLTYNLNTDHITISTSRTYQNLKYRKQYLKNNKDKISERAKKYYKKNYYSNSVRIGSDEWKIKCSCTKQGIPIEEFNGFISNDKYCSKFNESLKTKIRNKYNRKCFICDKNEEDNGRRLDVHHIDMNKNQGCDSEWKLIPVCMNCHHRVHNKLWEYRLKYLLNDI